MWVWWLGVSGLAGFPTIYVRFVGVLRVGLGVLLALRDCGLVLGSRWWFWVLVLVVVGLGALFG